MCELLTHGCCQFVTHANTWKVEIVKPETGPGVKLRLSKVLARVMPEKHSNPGFLSIVLNFNDELFQNYH